MEKNIKVWRKQVLKSQEPSFFLVNQAWVDQNMKFCDKHGLLIEYPEVKEVEVLEEKPKKESKKKVEIEKEIENNQNEIDNEETK